MQIVHDSIRFAAEKGEGPRHANRRLDLREEFTTVTSVLTGFTVGFAREDGDHELGNLDVRLDTRVEPSGRVNVTATFGLRDWSQEWDDEYEGEIFFAVIAE